MELVIVESPAKAKTIEKFLGKGFTVKSSYGHVRDLPKSEKSIDKENNFTPMYEVLPDKKKIIKELKILSDKADTVWLATDEDREGEAISWHLADVLKLKEEKSRRIVFHEITETAIQNAIKNPRSIDYNLVNAQQARRILDRLVGFELSPVLWRKVKPSLSAGRVQSVSVRIIVEREREIENFKSESSFKIKVNFLLASGEKLIGEYSKNAKNNEELNQILDLVKKGPYEISSIDKKPTKRNPAPPFTTSTLQQEASRKLGYSVGQTMSVAQKLYEAGHITYMRTDSVNLSELAVGSAKDEITANYGESYSKPRKFATKSKGAQEAHEAIRPTYFKNSEAGSTNQEEKLYSLIWKRAIASQMSEAKLEKTTVIISNNSINFQAVGEVLKFDGFLKIYSESKDDGEEDSAYGTLLPPIDKGEKVNFSDLTATQRFSHHPPRYTEASLVKKLENLGIGRPSTYAPTISTIQKRGYVVKEDRDGFKREFEVVTLDKNFDQSNKVNTENTGAEKKKLFPTDIGIVVNDFLVENFNKVLDYNFTADVEKKFDDIANGNVAWQKMIGEFYEPFHKDVEFAKENSEKANGERLLGIDPKTKLNVFSKIGRYGPMIQIGDTESEDKPKFASLKSPLSIGSVTLEQALKLFQLPKSLGEYEGVDVNVGIGRFGPYVRYEKMFVSIPKDQDPMTLTKDQATELIEAKKLVEANRMIKQFDEDKNIEVLNGRYGPYIKFGKKNYRIPKDVEPKDLSLADCNELIKAQDSKPKTKTKKTK
jgi:DNA topoisomerase I